MVHARKADLMPKTRKMNGFILREREREIIYIVLFNFMPVY